jgi:glycosyltransferase involved in cell wall biosynthesis
MRLLFITENYPPDRGGMAESCDRIVRGLARAGVRMDIVHFDRRCGSATHRATSSGSILRVPPDADVPHAMNLLWNRMQQSMDLTATTHVVAFGGTLPMLCAPLFAAWIRRPLATLIRGNELDAGLFDPRRRPVLDDAFARSAIICTVTRTQAERITALHPQARVRVVPNGIDFDPWNLTDVDRARATVWRSETVEPGRRVLGFFGHLKSKKGVPFFVDALSRSGLAERFHLLLAGEIDELPALAHSHLAPRDRFELLPFYAASDFVVLPSHYDGFPNVLLEGAALGKPLIASAVGGMLDVLTEGESAFLFEPGDDSACRRAVARAAEIDDAGLQAMGAAAAAVAQQFDARAETRNYLDVLEEVSDAKSAVDRGGPVARLSSRAR